MRQRRKLFDFGYDSIGQLKSATLKDASQVILKSYNYGYDTGGNRNLEAIDSLVTSEIPNNLNQLQMQQGGSGQLPIRGTTNEATLSVTVNGNTAIVKGDNTFEGEAAVTAGNNTVTVVATDVNNNSTTKSYSVVVTGSGTKTLIYDANGNLTSDGTRTFEWDPLDRLSAVAIGTHRSEFTYNGVGQRVKVLEKDAGTVVSTKNLIWVGPEICEERDANNAVTKRYYGQGMQLGATNYYYTHDHLGSVREMTDTSGSVRARYDYDPYGRRTKIAGDMDPDFGFAGYYYHQGSGLNLTRYRSYDPNFGRWISRDPIGEIGGINRYSYVGNSGVNFVDPTGLFGIAPSLVTINAGATTAAGASGLTIFGAIFFPIAAVAAWTPAGQNWISHNIVDPWLDIVMPMPSMPPPGKPPRPPGTSSDCPNPPNGDNEDNASGREAHKWWEPPEGFQKEFQFENGMRADAINFETQQILELKPDNPAAISRGQIQLQRYIQQAQTQFGGTWTGRVITY